MSTVRLGDHIAELPPSRKLTEKNECLRKQIVTYEIKNTKNGKYVSKCKRIFLILNFCEKFTS